VSRPVLVLQHGEWGPPGLLAEWLDSRGLAYDVHRGWDGSRLPEPADYAWIASLGSKHSPRDVHEPAVRGHLALLEEAVALDVPVLGLCFGGQALAAVLGGRVEPAPVPELGWREIETDVPDVVPPGPWLEWHFERFSTPPGAVELARTADAVQAFRHGPHLGVQFHPESTVEIVERWARSDAERLEQLGVQDGPALIAAPPERVRAAEQAAFALFDAFLDPVAAAAAV
jgi:GMP synthase-like glutamine amidotransferase